MSLKTHFCLENVRSYWEDFARNEYPLTKDESSESQGGLRNLNLYIMPLNHQKLKENGRSMARCLGKRAGATLSQNIIIRAKSWHK